MVQTAAEEEHGFVGVPKTEHGGGGWQVETVTGVACRSLHDCSAPSVSVPPHASRASCQLL